MLTPRLIRSRQVQIPYNQGYTDLFDWSADELPIDGGPYCALIVPYAASSASVLSSLRGRCLINTEIDFGFDVDRPISIPAGASGLLQVENLGLQNGNPPTSVRAYLYAGTPIQLPPYFTADSTLVLDTQDLVVYRPSRAHDFWPFAAFVSGAAGTVYVEQIDAWGVINTLDAYELTSTSPRYWSPLHRDCRGIRMTNQTGVGIYLGVDYRMA